MPKELISAIVEMQETEALKIAKEMLDSGCKPEEILDDCRQAMEEVGRRFETGEAFVPELILAGEVLSQITEMIKPRLKEGAAPKTIGKVVIGTVEGDIHDIGKDIVAFMLEVNGFEVTNLGVDVPPAKFVDAVQQTGSKVVALSGFLTLAYDPMKETVAALKNAGLEDVKVMIGGGQIDDQIKIYTGADAFGRDAMMAVSFARQWVGGA